MRPFYLSPLILLVCCYLLWQCRDDDVPPNAPPIIDDLIPGQGTIIQGGTTTITCVASDLDDVVLDYYWQDVSGPFTKLSSTYIWTAPDSGGVFTIFCRVEDKLKCFALDSIDIVVIKKPPEISELTTEADTVQLAGEVTLTCIADDPQNTLTYVWESVAGEFSEPGSTVTWNAPDSSGVFTISCSIVDEDGKSDEASIDIVVFNKPPKITEFTADPDTLNLAGTTTITCSAVDPDGDSDNLTYTWESEFGKITGSGPKVSWTAPDSLGVFTISCTVKDELGSNTLDSIDVLVINIPPEISKFTADSDTVKLSGTTTLSCVAKDPDGDNDALTYVWESEFGKVTGSGPKVSWTAPDSLGVYKISCTVKDELGDSTSAPIDIIVFNKPIVISELTSDSDTVKLGGITTLSCVANDPDGDNDDLTYTWESVDGEFSEPGPTVTWTAPDSLGVYKISCTVKDELGDSTSASIDIEVFNKLPVISTFTAEPDTVKISGTTTITCVANDPDGDSDDLTYDWQSNEGSFAGSGATVTWTTPNFSGTFPLTCEVMDINEGSVSASLNIVVRQLPLANAGLDQEVLKHMIVLLDGSGSIESDGNELTYHWSFASKPPSSMAEISEPHSQNPSFIADADGDYVLQLLVNNGIDSNPDEVIVKASSPSVPYKVHGINFSPYLDGQDPNRLVQISEDQIRNRMAVIAPYTQWIRTFGSTYGLEKSGQIAHSMGLKAAVSAWLDRNMATNKREIDNLIEAANAGHVDIAIVGSETLLRGDLSAQQLIDYLKQVKNAIPSHIPVTTGEICSILIANPEVMEAIDIVFFNQYSYWEGTALDCGVYSLHQCYLDLIAVANGKPVVVSETGWPSCGNTIAKAVPNPDNARYYFLNVISWARENNVPTFYFSAFDEQWKAAPEGPQGACWGIWDKDGQLKPGMQSVFNGETIPDNWTGQVIGGPGTPEIEFTYVPPIDSRDNLEGQVIHVLPSEYKVAVYILVGAGWWTKPTFTQPLTNVACDGSFVTDFTTGGLDHRASKIAAYLVPKGYDPPQAGGIRDLPPELEENSIAKVEVDRTDSGGN